MIFASSFLLVKILVVQRITTVK
ncbi:Protein of unknown function [Bacillus cereus]|nr:Protein of unknown function [Bacillus cereus]SCN31022.1 Protein of unknown function [Bacillus wiedmannii]